jgi:hypothetical protein
MLPILDVQSAGKLLIHKFKGAKKLCSMPALKFVNIGFNQLLYRLVCRMVHNFKVAHKYGLDNYYQTILQNDSIFICD